MEAAWLMPAQSYPTLIELEHRDWRSEWPQESRQWIFKQIESQFTKIFTGDFVSSEIPAIAEEFEEKIFYDMANSEVDYLRKIIFKLFCIIDDSERICSLKDDQTGSSSPTQSETNSDVTPKNFIQGNGLMPQYSNCTAVHQNPATSLHNGKENSICTGNHNQSLDWQEETFKQINHLVDTYGKRFCNIYHWVNEGPEKKGRSLVNMNRIQRWKDELDSILDILVTGKESVSLELKKKIPLIEKRIIYYINMKELSDCSQEIFSKLDTVSPDKNQTVILNEFIKAFLMERAKKHGVHIHLAEDDQAGYTITHSLSREITEIINEWCEHKIRILTWARPTMEEIEKELSIWQTPGSKLQQWCLLKHLPMKVGPVRQHPDLLFEEVCSVWKLYDEIELQQASLFQWHQQQVVDPARKPTSPVPQQVGPTTKGLDATQQKARPFQQMGPALHELPQYLGFSKQAGPRFGSVPQPPRPMPQQTGPARQQLPKYLGFSKQAGPQFGWVPQPHLPMPQQMGPALQQLQYQCLILQHTETDVKQPKLCQYLYFVPKKPPVPKKQYTATASPTHLSQVGGPRSMPAAA